jgi:crystallin, alpha B
VKTRIIIIKLEYNIDKSCLQLKPKKMSIIPNITHEFLAPGLYPLFPQDLLHSSYTILPRSMPSMLPNLFNRPWALLTSEEEGLINKRATLVDNIVKDKDGSFEVSMDVHQFTPKEISVKTLNNLIIVEGKHEERPDEHGVVERHFIRKYILPNGHDPEDVYPVLSADGILTMKGSPPSKMVQDKNPKIIPIQRSGPMFGISDKAETGMWGK